MSNREIGLSAFKKFYDWQKVFFPREVNYSLDDLLNSYGNKKEIFINGVGDMIVNGNVSNSRLDTALRSLAKDSQGRKLKNPIQISNYIQSVESKIDWVDAASFVATESLKDVAGATESIGKSIITTGKILNFLIPVIGVLFVLAWLNKSTGGEAIKFVKSFKK